MLKLFNKHPLHLNLNSSHEPKEPYDLVPLFLSSLIYKSPSLGCIPITLTLLWLKHTAKSSCPRTFAQAFPSASYTISRSFHMPEGYIISFIWMVAQLPFLTGVFPDNFHGHSYPLPCFIFFISFIPNKYLIFKLIN